MLTLRRLRSGEPRTIPIAKKIDHILRVCRVMPPSWPHQYVLRFDDGLGISVKEFNVIWKLYMRRRVEVGKGRTPFAFRDIRIKALSDQQDARRTSRRRIPRRGRGRIADVMIFESADKMLDAAYCCTPTSYNGSNGQKSPGERQRTKQHQGASQLLVHGLPASRSRTQASCSGVVFCMSGS